MSKRKPRSVEHVSTTTTTALTTTTTKHPSEFPTWQWTEWNFYSDDCEKSYKMRNRFCYEGQECEGSSFQVDKDKFEEDFSGECFHIMMTIVFVLIILEI